MKAFNGLIDYLFKHRVLAHSLYWIFSILIWAIPRSFEHGIDPLVNKLCYLPSQMIATYALIYYQIPRFVYAQKYLKFLLSFLLTAYGTTVIARITKIYIYETVMAIDIPKDPLIDIFIDPVPLLYQYLLWVYWVPFITLALKFGKDYLLSRQKSDQLRKEKAQAELGFLKAQLHPHFLFNTLNNLYTLTLRKADEAPEMIQKLSDILRYMTYYCNEPVVMIKQEIKLISNYIDLERLRYGDRLQLSFEYEVDDMTTSFTPLVLLSIVENAFKHGASGDIGKPQISINLNLTHNQLYFRVYNSKPTHTQTDETQFKKGIGVSNIKRQLDLIYPGQYQLDITETEFSYTVYLRVQHKTEPLK